MTRLPPGKLRWRCRRGMRELDALLARFLNECHASLSEAEARGFETLLGCHDADLFDWIVGRRDDFPDADAARVVRRLRALGAARTAESS